MSSSTISEHTMDDTAMIASQAMVTRRWLVGAAGLGGAVALLAACGGDDDSPAATASTAGPSTAEPTAETTAEPATEPAGATTPTEAPTTTESEMTTTYEPAPETITAALVQRFIDEAWNGGRLEVIDEIFTFPYSISSLNAGTPPFPLMDAAALKQHVLDYRVGFPDINMTTELVVEQDDSAFVQTRLKGTHNGPLMGIPPTGKPVDFVLSATYYSDADGKLAAHSVLVDLMGLFAQIGLVPDLLTIVTGAMG